jgi:hypothetical protein
MRRRELAAVVAAACVACCAGPIIAVLGGLGAAGLVSTLFIGTGGLLIAALAGVAFLAVRRRRSPASKGEPEPVPVELTRRPS